MKIIDRVTVPPTPGPSRYPWLAQAGIVILVFAAVWYIRDLPDSPAPPSAPPRPAASGTPDPPPPTPMPEPVTPEPVSQTSEAPKSYVTKTIQTNAKVDPLEQPKKTLPYRAIVPPPPPKSNPPPQPHEPLNAKAAQSSETRGSRVPAAWPKPKGDLKGENQLRIDNPDDVAVTVGVRGSDGRGSDLVVPPRTKQSFWLPDGQFEIYFCYPQRPDDVLQGDRITLNRQHAEIQLRKQQGGNYPLRPVNQGPPGSGVGK